MRWLFLSRAKSNYYKAVENARGFYTRVVVQTPPLTLFASRYASLTASPSDRRRTGWDSVGPSLASAVGTFRQPSHSCYPQGSTNQGRTIYRRCRDYWTSDRGITLDEAGERHVRRPDRKFFFLSFPVLSSSLPKIIFLTQKKTHTQEAWYEQDSFRKFGDRPYRWQSREYSIESCKDKKSFDFAQETWYAERRLPTPPEAANGRLDSQQEFSDGEIVPPENTNNNFGSVVDNADPAVKTTVGAIMGAGSFAAAAGNTLKAMWNGDGFSGSASSELSPS